MECLRNLESIVSQALHMSAISLSCHKLSREFAADGPALSLLPMQLSPFHTSAELVQLPSLAVSIDKQGLHPIVCSPQTGCLGRYRNALLHGQLPAHA